MVWIGGKKAEDVWVKRFTSINMYGGRFRERPKKTRGKVLKMTTKSDT